MVSEIARSSAIVAAAAIVAVALGTMMPFYTEMMGDGAAKLLLLPAFIVFMIMLIHDRRNMIILIILARASGDIFFDSTKFSFGGVQVGMGGLINLFVIMIAALLVFENPKRVKAQLFKIWLPFLAIAIYGVATSPLQSEAIRLWLGQLSNFAIFISAFYLVKTEQDFHRCLKLVLWSSIFPVFYGMYDVLRNVSIVGSDAYRLQSTFGHPNIFAFYLSTMLALVFYFLKSDRVQLSPSHKNLILVYFWAIVALLLLTKTRNAWIVTAGSFVVYAALFERRYFIYLLLLPIVGLMIPGVADRILDLGQGNEVITYAKLNSFAWRVYLWETAFAWAEPSRYLLGYGLSSFTPTSVLFFPLATPGGSGAHNVYVQILFELGLAGAAAYLWIYYKSARILISLSALDRLAAFALASMLIGYMISSIADNMLYYLSFNWYLWFVVGAGWALVLSHRAATDSIRRNA
ncbi:MAG: O-antigen ligase family protein [Pseudomonadota bacterium]